MCLSPKEIIDSYINITTQKSKMKMSRIIGKAIFAGIMIGMGAAGSSVAAHGIALVGIARLVAAVVFPVGLMMVILTGAELFTGDCLMIVGVSDKKITMADFCKVLALVFIGNFIGSMFISGLVYFSGQLDYSAGLLGAYTIKIAAGKAMITPLKGLTSGICCNILVCAAVLMALASKDVIGKLLASFFVIMLFVTSGYEHCVANMYYITAGLMAKTNPDYIKVAIEQYGMTEAQIALLNIKNMLLNNLLPVTIGNILGGSFVLGLPLYYQTRDKK